MVQLRLFYALTEASLHFNEGSVAVQRRLR